MALQRMQLQQHFQEFGRLPPCRALAQMDLANTQVQE